LNGAHPARCTRDGGTVFKVTPDPEGHLRTPALGAPSCYMGPDQLKVCRVQCDLAFTKSNGGRREAFSQSGRRWLHSDGCQSQG
jgi:hypothetical protein